MPLIFSSPPGILKYCNAGKHLKSVVAFLSCFFAAPGFIQLRALTVYEGKANRTATCSIIVPGDSDIRLVAHGIHLKKFISYSNL